QLLEAEGEHALVPARRDRLVPEVEGRRPGRAVVVDVVDGEPADAHRVERALSLRAHAVHVAGEGLLELLGCDTRHLEGAMHRLAHELGEVTRAALELRHADTDHAHVSLGHAGLLRRTGTLPTSAADAQGENPGGYATRFVA